jgi:hypothetical protein
MNSSAGSGNIGADFVRWNLERSPPVWGSDLAGRPAAKSIRLSCHTRRTLDGAHGTTKLSFRFVRVVSPGGVIAMHGIIYLVGLIVVVMAILSFVGLN